MPYADPAKQRAYQAKWMRERRAEWFKDKTCARCGASENLVLDHRDPQTKVSHRIWSWSQERRDAELAKCQALCRRCHRRKTAAEAKRGELAAGAKLNNAAVRVIRDSRQPVTVIAKAFGISKFTVQHVRGGRSWQHVA